VNPILLRSLRWVAVGLAGLVLTFVFALACTFVYLAPSLPTKDNMDRLLQLSVPLRVYTHSGSLVAQIGEQRRIPVQYEDIPLLVRQAVLAAEDDRFFEHSGLDWMGVARAMYKAATGNSSQGGSTISQQAARNVFLTLDRTLRRKLSEVFVTYRMESDFSKEQILAIYLNKILFGQRSYGIAAAAETYCGKRLDELTVAEAAMLAGIIQSPSRQNPVTSAKNAEARRSYVLRRMTELGYIDAATAAAAAKEPIDSREHAPLIDVEGAYVAEMVRLEFVKRFGESAVNAGYKVYTTLDDRLQTTANLSVQVGLIDFDRRQGYRKHLGKIEIPAAATDRQLDAALGKFAAVSLLEPAVVLEVAAKTADVHVRGRGKASISWKGLEWAAKAQRNGVGPAPKKAADVVKRGDVIHVVVDGKGNAELAQVPQAQAALVALDPRDGAIVSLVGGFDYHNNQFNRVTQAQRGPGSGFKPFLYSAALENGFHAASTINNAPVMVDDTNTEQVWRPENSGGEVGGLMRLREALVRSQNLVSIRLLQDIGVGALLTHSERFGFDTRRMPRNYTLALGTQTTTPLQMAAGFAVFANGGFKVEPYFIERIEDSTGTVVYQATPRIVCDECEAAAVQSPAPADTAAAGTDEVVVSAVPGDAELPPVADTPLDGAPAGATPALPVEQPARALRGMEGIPAAMRELASIQGGRGFLPEERLAPRVISAQNAWLMSDIMHDVTVRGTARRTQALGRDDLAGKTGTNEDRDTWFNGFTTNLVASVWVGYDDYRSLGAGAEGATTALPIWMHYMREALKGVPSSRMPRPGGLVDLWISPTTGYLADPADPQAITETFMIDRLPSAPRPGEGGAASTSSGEPLF
jgi:penicillin-binding protein 1A